MPLKRILALSSSRVGNGNYLEDAALQIQQFLGDKKLQIAFIPFASVQKSYDEYLSLVSAALAALPYQINPVDHQNGRAIIEKADAIMVGGGNTFKLLHDLYAAKLIDVIRNRADAGTAYIGWSAGSNITAPSICTTNDMPVIQPQSFNALGLFPFQINPHYVSEKKEGYNGETRDERLFEFMKVNPGISVVGLPEGAALIMENGKLNYHGTTGVLFEPSQNDEPVRNELSNRQDLSFLL